MTRAHRSTAGAGLAPPRARLFETSTTRDRVYVRSAPTLVRVVSELAGGHGPRGPIRSTLDGTFDEIRKIAWRGGNAAAFHIRSVAGEVDVMASSLELHFVWNSGYIEGEAQSGGKVISNENKSRFAYVLPPGTRVGFRLKEASESRQLSMELQPPQGILYAETAATLLAMHLVRNVSTVTPLLKEIRRGGLPPSRLRRACDYMMSRLGEGGNITVSGDFARTRTRAAFSITVRFSISAFATRHTNDIRHCGKWRTTCWREHRPA